MEQSGKAGLDETRAKTAPGRFFYNGTALFLPGQLEAVSSSIEVISTYPSALDSAPYFTAFVHSSLSAIASDRTAAGPTLISTACTINRRVPGVSNGSMAAQQF